MRKCSNDPTLTGEGFVRINFHRKAKHFVRVFAVYLREVKLDVFTRVYKSHNK